MTEVFQLLGDRGFYLWMTMPGAADCDTGAEIDIAFAFDIPDFRAECAFDKNRCYITLSSCDRFILACLPVAISRLVCFSNL